MNCFLLKKDNGAFFNNHRIRVSNKNNINDCLFVTNKLNNEIYLPIRKSGCAALDLAYVAAGRFDGYYQDNLNLWDIAAGIILSKKRVVLLMILTLIILRIQVIASNSNITKKFNEKLKLLIVLKNLLL